MSNLTVEAIAAQAAQLTVEEVKDLQIKLERIPGAYVSMFSRCLGDIEDSKNIELTDAQGEDVHAALYKLSTKSSLDIAQEAVDDMIDDLLSENVPK